MHVSAHPQRKSHYGSRANLASHEEVGMVCVRDPTRKREAQPRPTDIESSSICLPVKAFKQFGTAIISESEAIKVYFVRIDSSLEIVHHVHDLWNSGLLKILKGERSSEKRSDGEWPSTLLTQVSYVNGTATKVRRWFT